MEFISGENRSQILLLPDSIEEYIEANNAVRVLDAYINRLSLAELGFSKPAPHETGRPMYNPKDLLKLYVYGYMNRIRSSRRLETESRRNLEVLWLVGKLSPDHKTIARFRHDNAHALKNVFRDFVKLCLKLGLYGRELAAIDGSKFKAVNSTVRNFTEKKLQKLLERIDGHIKEYLEMLDHTDADEDRVSGEKTREEIAVILKKLKGRKERYQGYVEELERSGESQKSLTDPDSRLMLNNGKMDVCYNIQTAVDAENKLIIDFTVSNQGNDKNFITPMAVSAKEQLETDKITVVTDGGYESIQDMINATSQGVDVHVAGTDFDICVETKEGEGTEIASHHKGRCVYLTKRNIGLCPMGKVLYPVYVKKNKGGWAGVFYNYEACKQCTCVCTKDARGVFHYLVPMAKQDFSKVYNDHTLKVKQIRIKPEKSLIEQRKAIVEHPYGTIKRGMDAGYCLTKGLGNVTGEFALTFLAYNLKRVINILGSETLIANMA